MTETEAQTVCYFCEGVPVAIKRDATLEGAETESGEILPDVEIIELLPICEACNEYWYDGTETYPALLPLDTRP